MGLIASDIDKTTTGPIDTTGATLIVVGIRNEGSPSFPLTDSEGNTWQELTRATSANFGLGIKIAYCINPTTDALHTFTNGVGAGYTIGVMAFDNTGTITFDKQSAVGTAGGTSYTSVSSAALTPAQAQSIVVAFGFAYNASTNISGLAPQTGVGWNHTLSQDNPGADIDFGMAYKELTAATAQTATWNWTTAGEGGVCVAIFAADVSPPPDTTPPDITSTGTGSTNGPFSANAPEESTAAFITLTANENVTWGALGGADASRLVKLNETATTVQLGLSPALSFESLPHANPFVVTIQATDAASNSRTVTVNASVTNVIEPPGAPTIGTATAGNASASFAFTPPAAGSAPTVIDYEVLTSGGQTATGASSPITVTGMPNGVAQTGRVRARNSDGYGAYSADSNSVTPTAPGDSTPPTLSSPTGTGGQMVCSGSVSTNEGNGTLYAVVTASATAPTKNQVKLGQNHLGAAGLRVVSQAVTGTGVQNIASGAISSEGVRYWHFMQEDAAANQSDVVSSAAFTVTAYSMTIGPFGVAGVQQNGVQVYYSLSLGRGPGEMSVVKQGTVTTDGATGLATITHTAPGQAMVCYSPVAGTTFDVNKHTCVRYGTLA